MWLHAACVVYCDRGVVGLCFAGLSSDFFSMIISTIFNRKGSVTYQRTFIMYLTILPWIVVILEGIRLWKSLVTNSFSVDKVWSATLLTHFTLHIEQRACLPNCSSNRTKLDFFPHLTKDLNSKPPAYAPIGQLDWHFYVNASATDTLMSASRSRDSQRHCVIVETANHGQWRIENCAERSPIGQASGRCVQTLL